MTGINTGIEIARTMLLLLLFLLITGTDSFAPLSVRTSPRISRQTATPSALRYIKGFELSDLLYDDVSTAFDAWEWTANLGAPAALGERCTVVATGRMLSGASSRLTPCFCCC